MQYLLEAALAAGARVRKHRQVAPHRHAGFTVYGADRSFTRTTLHGTESASLPQGIVTAISHACFTRLTNRSLYEPLEKQP